MEEEEEFDAADLESSPHGGATAEPFWRAFSRYDHGRCWSGESAEDDVEGVAMQWELRGPARFEAERERALLTGGSRMASKVRPPYGDAGLCGRASYSLQLMAALMALAGQVETEARARGWELIVGVLAYREPQEDPAAENEADLPDDLITELDPEELARCDTLVLWVEVELPATPQAAWRLGDAFGRLMAGAATWMERLDAGDRDALRSVPRLQG